MVEIRAVPGKAEAEVTAWNKGHPIPPALLQAPGGLYPLKSAAFEVDEYRIMAGWPVPIPAGDIQVNCVVSASGALLSNRQSPTSITTGAALRWIADVDYYDQTALLWHPIQGNSSPWVTSPDHAPTLVTDYEYRWGDERWVAMTALNFDSNTTDYMWNNLDLLMGGTSGYTVIMVVNPNSIYGNDVTKLSNGLLGPQTQDGAWAAFTVKDQAIWMTTEGKSATKGVAIGNALSSTAPTYVALVVSRPQTTLYAASGPSSVLVKGMEAGKDPLPLSTRFWLGNAPLSGVATMDMALLDFGIYGNPLTQEQVVREITELSSVYGGGITG